MVTVFYVLGLEKSVCFLERSGKKYTGEVDR